MLMTFPRAAGSVQATQINLIPDVSFFTPKKFILYQQHGCSLPNEIQRWWTLNWLDDDKMVIDPCGLKLVPRISPAYCQGRCVNSSAWKRRPGKGGQVAAPVLMNEILRQCQEYHVLKKVWCISTGWKNSSFSVSCCFHGLAPLHLVVEFQWCFLVHHFGVQWMYVYSTYHSTCLSHSSTYMD